MKKKEKEDYLNIKKNPTHKYVITHCFLIL